MVFFTTMTEKRRKAADKANHKKINEIGEVIKGNHQSCKEKLARIVNILDLHRDTWPMLGFKTILGLILLLMVFYLVSHESSQPTVYTITWMTLLAIAAGLLSSCISGMLTFKTPLIKASGPLAFSGVLLYLMVVNCDTERQELTPETNEFTDTIISLFEIKEAHAQPLDDATARRERCGKYAGQYKTRIYYPAGVDYLKERAFNLKRCLNSDNTTVYSSGSFLKAIYNNFVVEDGQYDLWVRYNELIEAREIDEIVTLLDALDLDHERVEAKAEVATRAHIEIYLWPTGLQKPF
jgi:hypothetical protein